MNRNVFITWSLISKSDGLYLRTENTDRKLRKSTFIRGSSWKFEFSDSKSSLSSDTHAHAHAQAGADATLNNYILCTLSPHVRYDKYPDDIIKDPYVVNLILKENSIYVANL